MKRLAIMLAAAMLSRAALAADTPRDLYVAGKFQQAIAAGVAENKAAGFAIAARAELAEEMLRAQPCLDCLKRAENYARQAIAADGKNTDGHIYLAATRGYEARIVGVVTAKMDGYAEEARRHLDTALATDPDNAWALAALGGWNIEIVRNGGAMLGKIMYGASVDAGLADFAKAFKVQPGNLALRYQYALTLSGYDLDAYRPRIEDALKRASSGDAGSAYDKAIKARAASLLNLLEKNDIALYATTVRQYQGYP